VSDVKADIGNSQVSKQEILNLQTAFKNVATTAHKPSPPSVATMRTHKSSGLTKSESAVLTIYQSSNFSQQEAMQILQDFRAIFSALPSPPPQG
jgi:hypothetical protein